MPETELDAAIALVRGFGIPQFGYIWKSDSKLHRAIGWSFDKLGLKGYMDSFYTTFKYTVGRPNDAKNNGVPNEWAVFVHEGQHSIDAKRISFFLFALIYGLPQLLGLLAVPLAILLVLLTHSWLGLLGLLALAFLLPLPSLGRVWAELRGYRGSLSAIYWFQGIPANLEKIYLDEFLSYFSGSSYYWMGIWPLKSWIKKRLEFYLAELKAGRGYQGDPYLTAVRDLALKFANQVP